MYNFLKLCKIINSTYLILNMYNPIIEIYFVEIYI